MNLYLKKRRAKALQASVLGIVKNVECSSGYQSVFGLTQDYEKLN